jgi:formylglycine-generating enzyme required for sulfatase activity/CheY-like chemotaxis protein
MRILLVDDDTSVLQSLVAILKSIPGHEVRVAANAQKAIEHATALGGCDLLVTDVVMEPTDGFTLRNELLAAYPAMRTIFISGYDLSDYGEQIAGAHVLAKPVDADSLRGLVSGSVHELVATAVKAGSSPFGKPTTRANVGIPSSPPREMPGVAAAQPRAAQPIAQPVAQPVRAVPQASSPLASGVRAAVGIASGLRASAAPADDPLIGVQLGDYRVQRLLGKNDTGSVYLAMQLSVNRLVGLRVLDPARAEDEQARVEFLADARAKAAVQHPFIVSVFEADERNGLVFYTHEYLESSTLEELIVSGRKLDEKTALHVMKVAGEGLNYLWTHNLAHARLNASSLRIGSDGIARLSNPATAAPDPGLSPQAEIQTLGALVSQLVQPEAVSTGLRALLARMGGGGNAATSWPVVLAAVKALEPKVVPVEAAKIKAADAAAMRAVEAARKAQKRALVYNILVLVLLIGLIVFVVMRYLVGGKRDLTAKIEIPAGSYRVGALADGAKADLGAFDIDKYEVTIGDYMQFIEFCDKNPADEHKYDHPASNEKHVSHITTEIKTLIINAKKAGGGGVVFHNDAEKQPGIPIDLNSPMIGVSWWSAYAYAKWRGRDLPTEEEWEAAARGTRGLTYPWGDELKLSRFNSNEGYQPMKRGSYDPADGFNYWAPVDKFDGDESEFKVIGMAGNVAEWVYRKEGSREIPLVKGGSFASPPIAMFDRVKTIPAEDCWFVYPAAEKPGGTAPPRPGQIERQYVGDEIRAGTRALYIGFRTVKRK